MADVMDTVADVVSRVLGVRPAVIPSEAPGGGPEAERENKRHPGVRVGSVKTRGHDALGYGGHGDAVEQVDDLEALVKREIDTHVTAVQAKGLHEPRPSGRIRFNKPFSPEAYNDHEWRFVAGPLSLFDGTISAPGAGNSVQQVPIQIPAGTVSPVFKLNRYPGALYMTLYVRSFALMSIGSTMTGIQECWFSDAGGATAALGLYNPASSSNGMQSINALLTNPITDPGDAVLGTLTINNIGIGGTPVSVRYQLGVTYVAFYPDPWFNEQMIIPPRPAEIAAARRSMEA